MAQRTASVVGRAGLDELLAVLRRQGYRTRGPVVRDRAVVTGDVGTTADLPAGWHDDQGPGHYRLAPSGDGELFGWAVGPGSWKAEFLPPVTTLWRARLSSEAVEIEEEVSRPEPLALVGARPCDLAALSVLDGVLAGHGTADPAYRRSRATSFTVVAECARPAPTCFCVSTGTGPGVDDGFDLCLTELGGPGAWRYLVRCGSPAGREVLAQVPSAVPAAPEDRAARDQILSAARQAVRRRLPQGDVAGLLAARRSDPHWAGVAERCLSCGNCTAVCPTCFCTTFEDTTDLAGVVTRSRRWASCFETAHSQLHAGPVRASTASRYRQWLTHKLSGWVDQYGTPGCVGCGRCIAWCPAGIDITEEVSALIEGEALQADGRTR